MQRVTYNIHAHIHTHKHTHTHTHTHTHKHTQRLPHHTLEHPLPFSSPLICLWMDPGTIQQVFTSTVTSSMGREQCSDVR